MGKKIFWICILLFLVFDVWLAAKLISKKAADQAKPEIVVTENSGSADGQTVSAQNSQAEDRTAGPQASAATPATSPAEAKPVIVKPAKKISTKNIRDLKTALSTGLPVILKLGSDSCYPCKLMKPTLKELVQEQDGRIVVLDLDINDQRDLAREFRIRLIPAIIFYDRQGRVKSVHEGYLDKKQLLEWVDYLGLER